MRTKQMISKIHDTLTGKIDYHEECRKMVEEKMIEVVRLTNIAKMQKEKYQRCPSIQSGSRLQEMRDELNQKIDEVFIEVRNEWLDKYCEYVSEDDLGLMIMKYYINKIS